MQNIWSVADLMRCNPHWWSQIISSACGVNLYSRMMHKILYVVGKNWYASVTATICFIALLIDRYKDRLLPLLWQLLLNADRINKFLDLRAFVLRLAFMNFARIWLKPGNMLIFSFSTVTWNSKALDSVTCVSAVSIPVCLTSLAPCRWEKFFLHLAHILWKSVIKSPFSSFTILVIGW